MGYSELIQISRKLVAVDAEQGWLEGDALGEKPAWTLQGKEEIAP